VDTDKSSAPAPLSTEANELATLEERLAHELMDDEGRQELRDQVIRLRRRLGETS
jgi:hypothetical protein